MNFRLIESASIIIILHYIANAIEKSNKIIDIDVSISKHLGVKVIEDIDIDRVGWKE